jgi:uncharacterized phage infection (PIP) family protein YhgE
MTISREAIRKMVVGYLAGQQSGLMTANDVVDQLTDAVHCYREQFNSSAARYDELLSAATAKMMAKIAELRAAATAQIAELESAYTAELARLRAELAEARHQLATRRAIDELMESGRDPTKPLN